MFCELIHYLESTGDDFGLIRERDSQKLKAQGDANGRCALVLESSSLNCVVLRAGATLLLVEVEFAPETWWEELARAGLEIDEVEGHGDPVELPAGRYVFGDVNALHRRSPSPTSSLGNPAQTVALEWPTARTAMAMEVDIDSETRVVGYALRSQEPA